MSQLSPDAYLLAECRVAARRVADLMRDQVVRRRSSRSRLQEIETLECNLIRYFQGCAESRYRLGATRHRFGGSTLRLVFPTWEGWLKSLAYVVIEPGKVSVRVGNAKAETLVVDRAAEATR